MNRSSLFLLLLLASLLVPTANASADDPSFQFAAVGTNLPEGDRVQGARLAFLLGRNQVVSGADFGLLSWNESRKLSGAAFVFGLHRLTGDMDGGASFSLINWHSGDDRGLNAAFVNKIARADEGVNFGFLNLTDGNTSADIGALNVARNSSVQLGIVNVARKITGLQLGLINVAENGIFPFFPFFNFPEKDGD